MPKITKIEPAMPTIKAKKRVAAYARVSMETERLAHSLSAQISYYSNLIQKNPEWEYAGVFADNGISGTGIGKRTEFQRMVEAAENGEIDIILTKSIQRFARNTVDLLETVRHLKDIGVEVRFEKEHIHSMSGDGELMLTILASFAQEESRSISENVKWGTRKRMEQGIPNGRFRIFGYEWEGDSLVIVPEEAAVVRRIFQNFLDGKSRLETERELNSEGITTRGGYRWCDFNIRVILTNITYTGNLLLQREYIEDPISKKRRKNHGELPRYFVENTHEPIIDMDTFRYVQDEMARRKELGALANKSLNTSCFTGKIKCPHCGVSYMHDIRKPRTEYGNTLEFWCCGTKKKTGGRCPVGGGMNQRNMEKVLSEVLGLEEFDGDVFLEQVDFIHVPAKHTLEIHMKDGRTITRECKNTGHKTCWTEERRARASAYRKEHRMDRADYTCFTKKIKCPHCSCNFRGVLQTKVDAEGGKIRYWRCADRKSCSRVSLREDVLKRLTCEVLGLESFDENVFSEQIDRISVESATEIIYHMKDGSLIEKTRVVPKRDSHPWSEEQRAKFMETVKGAYTTERRARMSENMKQIRKERGANWRKEK